MAYLDEKGFDSFINGLAEQLKNVCAKKTHTHSKSEITDFPALPSQIIKATGTINGLGWANIGNGYYSQAVSVAGVTETNDVFVLPSENFVKMGCFIASQAADSITFKCTNPLDSDLAVKVLIFNF